MILLTVPRRYFFCGSLCVFFSVLRLLCLCARLFICVLWSPAGKGLTSWLSFVVSNCECHLLFGILGQVWYLIVSIPDLCTLSYFDWGENGLDWGLDFNWGVGKGLTSWLSFVMSNCNIVTFQLVSWVRCGAWLYRFLIFALLLTLNGFLGNGLLTKEAVWVKE